MQHLLHEPLLHLQYEYFPNGCALATGRLTGRRGTAEIVD